MRGQYNGCVQFWLHISNLILNTCFCPPIVDGPSYPSSCRSLKNKPSPYADSTVPLVMLFCPHSFQYYEGHKILKYHCSNVHYKDELACTYSKLWSGISSATTKKNWVDLISSTYQVLSMNYIVADYTDYVILWLCREVGWCRCAGMPYRIILCKQLHQG